MSETSSPAPSFHAPGPDEEPTSHEHTELFTLNGKAYTVENRARPNLSYGYMRRLRTEGQVAAEAWMQEKLLGTEALLALEEYEDMTPEDKENLDARLKSIVLGGASPKG